MFFFFFFFDGAKVTVFVELVEIIMTEVLDGFSSRKLNSGTRPCEQKLTEVSIFTYLGMEVSENYLGPVNALL